MEARFHAVESTLGPVVADINTRLAPWIGRVEFATTQRLDLIERDLDQRPSTSADAGGHTLEHHVQAEVKRLEDMVRA